MSDKAPWHESIPIRASVQRGVVCTSLYLTMRDGVKIAVDIFLPDDLEPYQDLPTIVHQTRYYRRMQYMSFMAPFLQRRDRMWQLVRRLVAEGYAVVNVDVRGSGASFGFREMEWSPDEVLDGAEVVDWIVRQPWSNGNVGTVGVSYTGTAAEMLLTNNHPAVKAAIIQYSLFDVYPDILRPGGVFNERFMRTWSAVNAALDADTFRTFVRKQRGWLAAASIRGVPPVDGDPDATLLQSAVRDHLENYDILATAKDLAFRDDVTSNGLTLDSISPCAHRDALQASGAAIYSWSGWYDGAYTTSVIKRFLSVKSTNNRLILGPWDHGGQQCPNPFSTAKESQFDHALEALRFLDYHLKGEENGQDQDPPVRYFTIGEEQWKESESWPPSGFSARRYYLSENRQLRTSAPVGKNGTDAYVMDYEASTGTATRWVTQINVHEVTIGYPDRKRRGANCLLYETPPLERDTEVTGHPLIHLAMRCDSDDVQVFVYLEDVWPDGKVYYVTEGLFRALHRTIDSAPAAVPLPLPRHSFLRDAALQVEPGEVFELDFALQPISYLFRSGHAIRIAIAGADRDNFEVFPTSPPNVEIFRNTQHASWMELPVHTRT